MGKPNAGQARGAKGGNTKAYSGSVASLPKGMKTVSQGVGSKNKQKHTGIETGKGC